MAALAGIGRVARTRRPTREPDDRKPRSSANVLELRTQVESMLNTQWSPQQISADLPVDYPDDPEMRVSHETIYRSLFVQARDGRCAKSSPRVCGQGVPVVARMGAKTQGATSKRWSSSRIDRLRSKTVRCLVIGKAT